MSEEEAVKRLVDRCIVAAVDKLEIKIETLEQEAKELMERSAQIVRWSAG